MASGEIPLYLRARGLNYGGPPKLKAEPKTIMLTESEKAQLKQVLLDARKKLARTGQHALNYSMNHERNIGRDSIDESMEE